MNNIETLIRDIQKALKIRETIKECKFEIHYLGDPVMELIDYAIKNGIINSTSDVLKLAQILPNDISQEMCQKFDESLKQVSAQYEEEYRYSGSYASIRELNRIHGTDFNERCIPAGAVIRGGYYSNSRC